MQEHCQKPALAQHSEHRPHTFEIWRSIHIPAVAVSKKPHPWLT